MVVWVAALVRVLNVVSVVYRVWHLKCDAGLTGIRLPTLGGYIREIALVAVCCSCLFIAAPVKTVFIFCDFAHCTLLLYLLAK